MGLSCTKLSSAYISFLLAYAIAEAELGKNHCRNEIKVVLLVAMTLKIMMGSPISDLVDLVGDCGGNLYNFVPWNLDINDILRLLQIVQQFLEQ